MADTNEQATNLEETKQSDSETATRKLGSEFYEEIGSENASDTQGAASPQSSAKTSYSND